METIHNLDVKGKKVLVRVDYNVPFEDDVIVDDTRIKCSLETINYLIDGGAKVIIMSHLGRVKSDEDKKKYSLNIVAKYLSKLVKCEVFFVPQTRGEILESAIDMMEEGTIVMMENTRFEDFPRKLESSCDEALSKYWASLADIFVFDAFGAAHRMHSSTYGVSKFLPSYAGFLISKEVSIMNKLLVRNKTIVMGGAKVDDKIPVIKNLIKSTNYLLLGGGICFTFLKAKGYNVGQSLVSEECMDFVCKVLDKYDDKVILPIDIVTDKGIFLIDEIPSDATGYDIGPKTIKKYVEVLLDSKLILWNGPLGKYEDKEYENGTKKIMKVLHSAAIPTVLVGGDIVAASHKYNLDFYYVSTGGGSTLEYLAGNKFHTLEKLNGIIKK